MPKNAIVESLKNWDVSEEDPQRNRLLSSNLNSDDYRAYKRTKVLDAAFKEDAKKLFNILTKVKPENKDKVLSAYVSELVSKVNASLDSDNSWKYGKKISNFCEKNNLTDEEVKQMIFKSYIFQVQSSIANYYRKEFLSNPGLRSEQKQLLSKSDDYYKKHTSMLADATFEKSNVNIEKKHNSNTADIFSKLQSTVGKVKELPKLIQSEVDLPSTQQQVSTAHPPKLETVADKKIMEEPTPPIINRPRKT